MLESMLFGYEKGAYTGAHQARAGKFEQANGGTILLDEISEMPLALQVNCCACFRSESSSAWAVTRSSALMCASLPPPTATSWKKSPKGVSVRFYYRLNVFPLHGAAKRASRRHHAVGRTV